MRSAVCFVGRWCLVFGLWIAAVVWFATAAEAQIVSQRGFVDMRGVAFPEAVPNDNERLIADALVREEVTINAARWLDFDFGVDVRANTYGQVEDDWRLDLYDRGVQRPRLALRRLGVTLSAGGFALDLGKQFIRWGRADIIYPTDRFAPRDYLNVFDSDLLPVIGGRASFQIGSETLEGVWIPRFTPSRAPLLDQRWTVVPPEAAGARIADGGSRFPQGSQFGARWRHTGERLETALSFFDGYNHLPNIATDVRTDPEAPNVPVEVVATRVYPAIRMFGLDAAIPASWGTLKLEAAYVTSPSHATEEYLLYVIEIERQFGEWLIDVGYAGDVVTTAESLFPFAPDRGVARSFLGRAAYTVDPRRTAAVEAAVRQAGEGIYVKGEYSEALGQHWRFTLTGTGITGERSDFLGQFESNGHVSVALRASF